MVAEIPNYVDDGALREQDQVPLRAFLSSHDRAQPTGRGLPFFSGRETEVNAFRDAANGILIGHQANATVVVEGPPGAGKSALLAQFQEEMLRFPPVGPNGRRWLPVRMDGREGDSPAEIMSAVDDAMALRMAQDVLAKAGQDGGKASRRLLEWLGEIGGEAAQRRFEDTLAAAKRLIDDRGGAAMGFRIGAQPDLSGLSIRGVAARRRSAWRQWQVVLLIDEAQRIVDAGGALSMLHQDVARIPVTFCAFGLPGTSEALYEVGVSRETVGYSLHLGGLEARASRMAVRRCFAQYGVTHGEAWVEGILSRSANWPQHLAAYLNAALRVLKENAPSPDRMGDARRSSLDKAIEAGDASRASYCAGRMKRLKRDDAWHGRYAKALVSWMAREGNAPPDRSEDEVIDFLSGPPLELTKGEVTRFLNAARHAGLIERTISERLRLSIPSFTSHLLDEPLQPIPPAPPRKGSSHGQ